MDFDFKEFRKTKFQDRTRDLELKNFGDSKDIVIWKIRGLSSEDLAQVEEEIQKSKMLIEMADMLAKAVSAESPAKDKTAAIQAVAGLNSDTPEFLIKQFVVFELGSLDPKPGDRADTVKFAHVYPAEFKRIVNEIYRLTDLGGLAKKKPSGSGQEQISKST